MAWNTYSEIRKDLRYVADQLEEAGIKYRAYNNGLQFNAVDVAGHIHTYYPTTGTVVVHKDNSRQNHDIKCFYNIHLSHFIRGMKMDLSAIYFKEAN